MSDFTTRYLAEAAQILGAIDPGPLDAIAQGIAVLRSAGGRLFILGVGGSAGHAGHAVNDFRKLCDVRGLRPHRQRRPS